MRSGSAHLQLTTCSAHCAAVQLTVYLTQPPRDAQVKLIMRFLSDTSLSGGSWLWACPTPSTAPTHVPCSSTSTPAAPAPGLSVGPSQDLDSSSGQQTGASGAGSGGGGGGGALFELVPHGSSSRRSSCDIEVVCSWRCIHSLTPDATQLAQQDWRPPVSCRALSSVSCQPVQRVTGCEYC